MKSFSFFLFATVLFSLPGLSVAENFYSLQTAVKGAVAILTSEIERDEEIVSTQLNSIRLRMARTMIAPGLKPKQDLVDSFARLKSPDLSDAINALNQTLADEKFIVNDTRSIGPALLRQRRTIRNNIKLKKSALSQFQGWLLKTDNY